MKRLLLFTVLLTSCSQTVWAIYGPSLTRADVSLAAHACEEGHFLHSREIAKALRSENATAVLPVLADALKEWQRTPESSSFYPARAFCIHELVPTSLHAGADTFDRAKQQAPTAEVLQFQALGIDYFFYEPDGLWRPRKDPVDLNQLAAKNLDSQWGRQAFLMMTDLGWSQGACQEGPDEFREVIRHGRAFLASYPNSEVSDQVRLEVANAYATWWNLSQSEPNPPYSSPDNYKAGAVEAKEAAIKLYQEYLDSHADPTREVQDRLRAMREDPKGSDADDYFCPDYED